MVMKNPTHSNWNPMLRIQRKMQTLSRDRSLPGVEQFGHILIDEF